MFQEAVEKISQAVILRSQKRRRISQIQEVETLHFVQSDIRDSFATTCQVGTTLSYGQCKPEKKNDQTLEINSPNVETSILIDRDDMHTEVFSWGNDANGQLGLGIIHGQGGEAMEKGEGRDSYKQPQPRFCIYGITIKLVSCGAEHSVLVTDLNFVYSIGSNRCGQLGIRDT